MSTCDEDEISRHCLILGVSLVKSVMNYLVMSIREHVKQEVNFIGDSHIKKATKWLNIYNTKTKIKLMKQAFCGWNFTI